MKIRPDKATFKILSDSGAVSQDVLERSWKEAEQSELPFLHILLASGAIKEVEALKIFSEATHSSIIDLKKTSIDPDVFKKVPVKFAWYYKLLPIRIENGKLTIAVSRIVDINTLDEMKFGLGFDIETVFAPSRDIEEMLKRNYGLAAETVDKILASKETTVGEKHPAPASSVREVEDIEALASIPSVSNVVNQIISDAYHKRASDIHLEPFGDEIRLRYRIDGVLHEAPVPPEMKKFFLAILSRIKITSNLNIVERRLPQEGKMRVKTQNEMIDLRISIIPTLYGESMVIRILPAQNILTVEELGFEPENLAIIEELLKKQTGVLFVTGPTGSGKSTTLYAALNRLNSKARKIMTVEDPVEYELKGINQIQVSPEAGLTFSRGLRSMLRHDPDIMMVGEVRDLETADITIRAALTGHLILSTLHTNDAVSGITRLLDIGVEPYLVASSVVAFIAQRLVRKICPHCKEKDPKSTTTVAQLISMDLDMPPNESISVFRGKGCDHCNNTGFLGRVALHEIFVLDADFQKMIMDRGPSEMVKLKAIEKGMITLRKDGWRKVLNGITTADEVLYATSVDAKPSKKSAAPSAAVAPLSSKNIETLKQECIQEETDFAKMRKHKRLNIEIAVSFRVIESLTFAKTDYPRSAELRGATEDISAGGMLYQFEDARTAEAGAKLEDPLAPGDILEFKIELPDGEKAIECMGRILKVRRASRHAEKRDHIYAAVLFLAINSTDRTRLEKLCEEHLSR